MLGLKLKHDGKGGTWLDTDPVLQRHMTSKARVS